MDLHDSSGAINNENSALSSSSSHSSVSSQADQFIRKFQILSINYLDTKGLFQIESKSLIESKKYMVLRNYDDFQALYQILKDASNNLPIICAPLPDSFEPEEKRIPPLYLRVLKDSSISIENSIEFSHFLNAILSNETLSSNNFIEKFLTENKFTISESNGCKVKQSSFLKILNNKWKSNYRDYDDFYENQRYFASTMDEKLQTVKNDFELFLTSNRKLDNVLAHLSTCITSTLVINESQTQAIGFNKVFCESLDNYKNYLEVNGQLAYQTLGVILQYLYAYNMAYKEMLSIRIELMNKYENANKNLQRKMETKYFEKVSNEKKQAELNFELFSEKGRSEVKHYHNYRCEQFVEYINLYVESQLAMSNHTVKLLKSCIASLKSKNN